MPGLFTVAIELGNSSFSPNPECDCARILRKLADELEANGISRYVGGKLLYDINGNGVGEVVTHLSEND